MNKHDDTFNWISHGNNNIIMFIYIHIHTSAQKKNKRLQLQRLTDGSKTFP